MQVLRFVPPKEISFLSYVTSYEEKKGFSPPPPKKRGENSIDLIFLRIAFFGLGQNLDDCLNIQSNLYPFTFQVRVKLYSKHQ